MKMSHCPDHCMTCTKEAHKEYRAKVCEHAAMCACHVGHLPYVDLDLLGVECEAQKEDECKEKSTGTPDPEFPEKNIEVGDRIYATTSAPLLQWQRKKKDGSLCLVQDY
ncbi:hypothetical protein J132_01526 [Termitomyces sp. J132]|nr:hypothetical protein J132_01526 [Termitomyces sp. J132]